MGKAHEKAEKWKDAEALYNRYSQHRARAPSTGSRRWCGSRPCASSSATSAAPATRSSGAIEIYKRARATLDDDGKYFAAKARYMQGERILAEFERSRSRATSSSSRAPQAEERAPEEGRRHVPRRPPRWASPSGRRRRSTRSASPTSRSPRRCSNSPPPAEPDAEQKELYSQQIDEFVVPIEEREHRGVRERLAEGRRARHLQRVDGEDARGARPPEHRAVSAVQGDRLRAALAAARCRCRR